MKNLENRLVGIANWWATKRHREPDVVLDAGRVEIDYRKPADSDKYQWDDEHYSWGNVHFKGKAEAAVPDPDASDPAFRPSANFSAALIANDLVPKALLPGSLLDELKRWVMVAAAGSALAAVIGIAVMAS